MRILKGLLARAIETDPEIRLIGTAMHGQLALNALRKEHADVVVLDVEMPVMDGLTALQHIQKEFPRTKVIMASGQTYDGAETTMKALALGAAGCIAKPVTASTSASIEQVAREHDQLVGAVGRRPQPAPVARAELEPGCVGGQQRDQLDVGVRLDPGRGGVRRLRVVEQAQQAVRARGTGAEIAVRQAERRLQ